MVDDGNMIRRGSSAHKNGSNMMVEEENLNSFKLARNSQSKSMKDGSFLVSLAQNPKLDGHSSGKDEGNHDKKASKRKTRFKPSIGERLYPSSSDLSIDKLYIAHGVNRELSGSNLSFSSTISPCDLGQTLDKLPLIKLPPNQCDSTPMATSSLKYGRKYRNL